MEIGADAVAVRGALATWRGRRAPAQQAEAQPAATLTGTASVHATVFAKSHQVSPVDQYSCSRSRPGTLGHSQSSSLERRPFLLQGAARPATFHRTPAHGKIQRYDARSGSYVRFVCSAKRIYVNMAPTYYDFANIRAMLAEGYSNEELLRLCFYVPEFQSFYRDWQGVPISTERLIQEIL